ncbi:MAG: RluA family pseudouridine synthase [Candidatus Eremiobacteraeota bacterium]|nr:RluA family pseudouridine synthase [Candidatus Eremiobacteraeota bacterium]
MQHVVTPEEAGARADLIVARIAGVSRSIVADAVKRGDILLNGAVCKGSVPLTQGDILDFTLQERPVIVAEPESIDVPIVYEDEDLLVVNKPAGMTSHPAHGSTSGTLVNALLGHVGSLPGEDALRPGLVHRLDRDTSGLLVVAKTTETMQALSKAMRNRYIKREYLGLAWNPLIHPRGTIDGAIGRDPMNRLKYTITPEGKPSVTHYELREKLYNASEIIFRLETGRTHQIRVHMAAMGHPIVNDPVYGKADSRFPLPGQALHAWRLHFRHPRTREDLEFEQPPPREYVATKAMLYGKL